MSDIFIVYGGHLHAGFTVFDASTNTVSHYADDDCRDSVFNGLKNALVKDDSRLTQGLHMYNVNQYKKIKQFFKIIDASNHKVFNDLVVNIYHLPNKLPPRAFCLYDSHLHYRWGYFQDLLDNNRLPPIYTQRILKNELIIEPPYRNGPNDFKDISSTYISTEYEDEEGNGAVKVSPIEVQTSIVDEIYRRVDCHNDVCIFHLQDVDPQQNLKFESQHTNEYIYTNESVVFNTRGNRVKNSILI